MRLEIREANITKDWNDDLFESVYNDDGTFILESKKAYKHEEEGLEFNYHYVIHGFCLEEDRIIVTMTIVIDNDSMCKEFMCRLKDFTGTDEDEIMTIDKIFSGCYITFQTESIPIGEEEIPYDLLEHEDVLKIVNFYANSCEAYDSMRGFFLDTQMNMIGETWWDKIKEQVRGAEDYE